MPAIIPNSAYVNRGTPALPCPKLVLAIMSLLKKSNGIGLRERNTDPNEQRNTTTLAQSHVPSSAE
jgi:hypothetical protein